MNGCIAPIPVYDFFPKQKPMKKTIPFDIEKAKAGAKVVTSQGQEVKILTYEGRDPERPIIGTFMQFPDYTDSRRDEEVVSRWSITGEGVHPGGVDLMIEEEISEVDYEDDDELSKLARENIKLKEKIEIWKEQALKSFEQWDAVHNYIVATNDLGDLGRPVQSVVLKRLEERNELLKWKAQAIKSRKHFYKCLKNWEGMRPDTKHFSDSLG